MLCFHGVMVMSSSAFFLEKRCQSCSSGYFLLLVLPLQVSCKVSIFLVGKILPW